MSTAKFQCTVHGKIHHEEMKRIEERKKKRKKCYSNSNVVCSMLIPFNCLNWMDFAHVFVAWKNHLLVINVILRGKLTFHWESTFLFDRWWHLQFEFSSLLVYSNKNQYKNVDFIEITIQMTLYQLVALKMSVNSNLFQSFLIAALFG